MVLRIPADPKGWKQNLMIVDVSVRYTIAPPLPLAGSRWNGGYHCYVAVHCPAVPVHLRAQVEAVQLDHVVGCFDPQAPQGRSHLGITRRTKDSHKVGREWDGLMGIIAWCSPWFHRSAVIKSRQLDIIQIVWILSRTYPLHYQRLYQEYITTSAAKKGCLNQWNTILSAQQSRVVWTLPPTSRGC